MAAPLKSEDQNIFLRMHPLQRILLSLLAAAVVFFIVRTNNLEPVLLATVLWDVFALSFLIISWIVLFTRPQQEILKVSNKDDGSRIFVLASILITSFASMFTVALLMISQSEAKNEWIDLPVAIGGMLLSWAMVHTLFTFHYAHIYYGEYEKKKNKNPDLLFPGDKAPGYIDFAYFSFVIGMTFQVSDVEIASSKIRRTVLAHGLLSFVLNNALKRI